MTRKYLYVLAALLLALALSACTQQQTEAETSYPTLPSFPEEQTPAQQLSAAIGKTASEESYVIRYGTVTSSGEETMETAWSQDVSPAQPLDRDTVYEKVAYLPTCEDFLESFCSRSLRAVPSNTGVIRYQLTDLTWEDVCSLLYKEIPEGDFEDARCAVVMEVDAAGRFSRLEVTMETENDVFTAFLSLTFPDEP